MWVVQVTSLVLVLVLLVQSWALPVEKTQSSSTEMLDRLRKMTEPGKKTRPEPIVPEPQKPISKNDASKSPTTPAVTTTTTTTTSAPPVGEPEKVAEPPAPSSEENHSYVFIPMATDPNTLSQIQNHVTSFQTSGDPYNQIQVAPFRPPVLSHNNYLQYTNYMRNRQNNIIDRFTNFAGNFFPVEIDVPDLIGSLTSWIPGAQLIGQLITGNRPNSRRFAVLGGNGQVYVVEIPDNQFQAPGASVRMPYPPHPYPAPYDNFATPFRPYLNQEPHFNRFFSRNSIPNTPPIFNPGFHNAHFPGGYPEIPTADARYDFVQSRINEMEPSLNEDEYSGRFENNANIAILPNQMYNGNLHIPEDGVLVQNERSLFPQGRSFREPESAET